jgi:filamentous hemagglutinin family protein
MAVSLRKKCFIVFLLFQWLSASVSPVLAGTRIPGLPASFNPVPVAPTQLPVQKTDIPTAGISSITTNTSTDTLTVNQNQSSALVSWQSFNIGQSATVIFNQQGNRTWGVLNRIYDQNPSQIMGTLKADGKVYLINQNGILFGPKSQVNTNTFAASTQDVSNQDFQNGVMHFQQDSYNGTPNGAGVLNQGTITAGSGGSVFLVGPSVENSGTITAPSGQIGLVAGTDVTLTAPDVNSSRAGLIVNVNQNPGTATNDAGGQLTADTGLIGMYGSSVYQNGSILASTSVLQHGTIELLASDLIYTGQGSLTASPIDETGQTVDQRASTFQGGSITFGGLSTGFPQLIEHYGSILAPSGNVTMTADQRVYLGPGSSVDVSGLWLDESVSNDVLTLQLNSVQLRDSYDQKGGILQGANVTIWAVAAAQAMTSGNAIADFSGALAAQQKTASEFATKGGTVTITSNSGDIIEDKGASINIAGGGIRYSGGVVDDTLLLSGNTVYDIANAPESLHYDQILGSSVYGSSKWGIQTRFPGLYASGSNPVNGTVAGYTQGSDAGSLILDARQVFLNGSINASVVQGIYQTQTGAAFLKDQDGNQFPNPLEKPVGGSLVVGNYLGMYAGQLGPTQGARYTDYGVDAILVTSSVNSAPLGPNYPLYGQNGTQTVLSAQTLDAAGFGSIGLYTNTTFTLDKGAVISMAPGATFDVTARRIVDKGVIDIPSGSVGMTISENYTSVSTPSSTAIPLQEEIYLDDGSSIDVSGMEINNSLAGTSGGSLTPVVPGNLAGGQVSLSALTLLDGTIETQGVFMKQGSSINVNGGWALGAKGNITGGNAGSLTVQGPAVVLDGNLSALALPAFSTSKVIQGGSITLVAQSVEVTAAPSSPLLDPGFNENSTVDSSLAGKLILAGNRLDTTGFTSIELDSINNLNIDQGVTVSPSTAKLALPGGAVAGASSYASLVGPTSFVAKAGILAGVSQSGSAITMDQGSAIQLPPSGSSTPGRITMQAPTITLAGVLNAPGGNITINATPFGDNPPAGGGLTLASGCSITAEGYNKPNTQPLITGLAIGATPMNGGKVSLASNSDLTIDSGASVDVSGSDPVQVVTQGKGSSFSSYLTASNPGSISIAFGNANTGQGALTLDGLLLGRAKMSGLPGGTLSITNQSLDAPLILSGSDIGGFTQGGFDALTFKSPYELVFQGGMDLNVGRSLTLDSPEILASGDQPIQFHAPWVRLIDSNTLYSPSDSNPQSGGGSITFSGDWIDVQGAVTFSGFNKVSLITPNDISLSGAFYSGSTAPIGLLATAGDLTLQADRIYPSYSAPMYPTDAIDNEPSTFTINSGGVVTILPGDGHSTSLPIYSAGNALTIDGKSIDDEGFLAAPLGQITLNATDPNGRVYLGATSTIRTSSPATAEIEYGSFTADGFWSLDQGATQISSAPASLVSLNGAEVIVQAGATIDTSGGGKVVGHQWLPDIQGSVDPITGLVNSSSPSLTYTPGSFASGRYVIVPVGTADLPDAALFLGGYNAVYLAGSKGLPAGTYAILPEQYAFLPGAMVVTDLKTSFTPSSSTVTKDGYPVVGGYLTVLGTGIQGQQLESFSVQTAAQVLKQGNFTTSNLQAGGAGNVTLAGNTVILDGNILTKSLAKSQGGVVSFSGTDITVQTSTGASLPSAFNFSSSLGQYGLGSGTYIADSALAGVGEVDLGNSATQTVTLDSGTSLVAPIVKIAAGNSISLQAGSLIDAESRQGNGTVSLTTNGTISVLGATGSQPQAMVHASDSIFMEAGALDYQGGLLVDHGSLTLATRAGVNMTFVPGTGTQSASGFVVSSNVWSHFGSIDSVILQSGGDVDFQGKIDLAANKSFSIESSRIEGESDSQGSAANVAIQAPVINIFNTGNESSAALTGGPGQISVNAAAINIGHGSIHLDGFNTVKLNVDSKYDLNPPIVSANDVTFLGAGSLKTDADLTISAPRITTSYYQSDSTSYEVADFAVQANSITLAKGNGTAGISSVPGGSLSFAANNIDVATVVEVQSGQVTLTAEGGASDSINVESGAQILARGWGHDSAGKTVSYAPGGSISIQTDGKLIIAGTLNVEAGAQGDAGSISLSAPNDSITLTGNLLGSAENGGRGGSFTLDTDGLSNISTISAEGGTLTGFSALNAILQDGATDGTKGFTENIDIRVRGVNNPQDLSIADNIYARNFNLTADNGSIDFSGEINSTGFEGGGTIQFNTGRTFTLEAGSKIISPGATVFLNTADSDSSTPGYLNFSGTIDVTGATGQTGGIVHFRSSVSNDLSAVDMNLAGKIQGASQILAEGVLYGTDSSDSSVQAQPYTYASNKTINSTDIGHWQSGIEAFMSDASQGGAIQGSLFSNLQVLNSSGTPQFVPGLEIRSAGNLTLQSAWDLTTGGWDSFGPGLLTLRAGGNLDIYDNLVDHPSTFSTFSPLVQSDITQLPPSWGFNLVAGADFNSSDLLRTNLKNAGTLYISADPSTLTPAMVYTENGPIQFASAGDTRIGSLPRAGSSYMINSGLTYNLGTYGGNILGQVGGGLYIEGGAIQSAAGNIVIQTGGDLKLGYAEDGINMSLGTIRTTGLPSDAGSQAYWAYTGGGNILLDIGGSVKGDVNNYSASWDYNAGKTSAPVWSPSYNQSATQEPTQGLATLGGGNLTVYSGGSFLCQAGTFGGDLNTPNSGGNLTIYSGGNMSGRFLVKSGTAELDTMGNFGAMDESDAAHDVLEAFHAEYTVMAQGSIGLGAVLNPTLTRSWALSGSKWDLTYAWDPTAGPITSTKLEAVSGDVFLYGVSHYDSSNSSNQRVLVATPYLEIDAGRDIFFGSSFALPPSPTGNLVLNAGRDIYGAAGSVTQLYVSDENPEDVYGSHKGFAVGNLFTDTPTVHDSNGPVHLNDPDPISITAGGSIENLQFFLSKFAEITAGADIDNIYYSGMNTAPDDVTVIRAGGDIAFSSIASGGDSGMQQGGPGWFVVQAGGSIDLGATQGIRTVGNQYDPALSSTGSSLVVISGYGQSFDTTGQSQSLDQAFDTTGITSFFSQLQAAGVAYSTLQSEGQGAAAQQVVDNARNAFIASLNKGESGTGNIEMTDSQICTLAGGDGVYILAAGTVDVGKTTFLSANTGGQTKGTGIYTASGGGINMFAVGDVNVNESRVMTFLGGDITVWSDQGGINAGRGSKSAISASPPHFVNMGGGLEVLVFQPPSVGSGIRTLTYDPDGPGPLQPPAEGNIYLFAPSGTIDAGEAGIAGNKVFLGAIQVLNVQNISFSGGSVGVPSTSAAGPSLGALAGVSNLSQAITSDTLSNVAGGAGNAGSQAASGAFAPQWVDVKVIGFYESDQ